MRASLREVEVGGRKEELNMAEGKMKFHLTIET